MAAAASGPSGLPRNQPAQQAATAGAPFGAHHCQPAQQAATAGVPSGACHNQPVQQAAAASGPSGARFNQPAKQAVQVAGFMRPLLSATALAILFWHMTAFLQAAAAGLAPGLVNEQPPRWLPAVMRKLLLSSWRIRLPAAAALVVVAVLALIIVDWLEARIAERDLDRQFRRASVDEIASYIAATRITVQDICGRLADQYCFALLIGTAGGFCMAIAMALPSSSTAAGLLEESGTWVVQGLLMVVSSMSILDIWAYRRFRRRFFAAYRRYCKAYALQRKAGQRGDSGDGTPAAELTCAP